MKRRAGNRGQGLNKFNGLNELNEKNGAEISSQLASKLGYCSAERGTAAQT